jgi:hypothetical protein
MSDPDQSVLALAAAGLTPGNLVTISASTLNTLHPLRGIYPNEGVTGVISVDWSLGAAYDQISKKGYCAGAPAGWSVDNNHTSGICVFDLNNNHWYRILNPWDISIGHAYDGNAIDPDGILYKSYFSTSGDILRFDTTTELILPPITGAPYTMGTAGSWPWETVSAIAFHPNLGASGSLVFQNVSRTRTLRWDKATEVWSVLVSENTPANTNYPYSHYNPIGDVVVTGGVGAGEPLHIVHANGTVTQSANIPVDIFTGVAYANNRAIFLPDPNSSKSLLFCPNDGNIYELETTTGVWSAGIPMPTAMAADNCRMLADKVALSIPEYNCILIATYYSGGNSTVNLYRHS